MKKILIIEDDQLVASIYRNKLSAEGFHVDLAADGETGLASVQKSKPDAVILDLMLPRLSGVELMKKVRAEPGFEKLPIIVFSNTYLTNMVQDAWKAGATKCLSKANCSPKQLISIVRNVVSPEPPPSANPNPSVVHATNATATSPHAHAHSHVNGNGHEPAQLFREGAPVAVASLRASLQLVVKGTGPERLHQLETMYRQVHGLTAKAALASLNQTAQMGDALEALLKELHDKPANINASTLRTVAAALDFFQQLLNRAEVLEKPDSLAANILVVDDEAISRRAVTHALERAKLKAVAIDNPQLAFNLISENSFDLIFLDVDMPGINGYELCAKIRALQGYKTTPVVFVTGLSDFEARANSMMSGGNDFIGKPFLFIELAVKALIYVLRSRISH